MSRDIQNMGLFDSLNVFKKKSGKYYRPSVVTGKRAEVPGYYIYKGRPDPCRLPAYPDDGEKVIYLKKGDLVPPLKSYGDEAARYMLIVASIKPERSRMPVGPAYLTTSSSQ